jgi:hypothetical protein
VVAKLIHALEVPRPRPRYAVTLPTHLFAALKRVLGTRGIGRVLLRSTRDEWE